MSQPDDHLAIVFSDIVGSSSLYSTLGNKRAKEKIDQAIDVMIDLVVKSQGRVIKTIGDEIMFAHSEPEQACEAAVYMNMELKGLHFYLRTGVSYGRVIMDNNDLYGDTVNNAAFLVKSAQSNQILLDSNTYANLTLLRRQCEYFDRITLKGQSEQSLVYRLNWEHSDTTSLDATVVASKAISAENGISTQLLVTFEGKTYYVTPSSQISVGRDYGSVQICVKHKNASRKHCSLSYHRGKFVLEDHSTNGTYLSQKGHQEVFLRRESVPLMADGKISLGQPSQKSKVVLEYHLD